jgi:hypothetical protein
MRGPVAVNGELVYGGIVEEDGGVRLRISADEADRLQPVEGQRIKVGAVGGPAEELLVVAVTRAPPFVWLTLTPLAGQRAG